MILGQERESRTYISNRNSRVLSAEPSITVPGTAGGEMLKRCCPVCNTTEGVVTCAACKVMPYCGCEHQVSHRDAHKARCAKVKKTREAMQKEDEKLRNSSGDFSAFEDPDLFGDKYGGDLSHLVAISLVKIRMLQDLQKLQKSVAVHQQAKLPQEISDQINRELVGNIVGARKELYETSEQTANIKRLEEQVNKLYKVVNKTNKHFWPAIVNPRNYLTMRPNTYGMGSKEEMAIKLQYSYTAWAETPGAIDFMKAKRT